MPKKRGHGDGGLYAIRNGTLWRGVVDVGFDADGKRVQKYVTARTKTEAKRKLDALKAEIAEHGAPLQKQATVAQWASKWLETVALPNVDPKTYASYASNVRRWIVPTIGRKRVSTLKPSDISAVRAAAMDAGRATSTARGVHIVLSMMLDAARAEGLCRTNVADDVRKPGGRGTTVKTERGALTLDQVIAILEAASSLPVAEASRWWFKILAGQRQGEVLGAVAPDLDLDAATYTVSWKLEDLRRDHGCGDNPCGKQRAAYCPAAKWRVPDGFEYTQITGAWHLTRPKSRTGRIVPLVPPLVAVMRKHLEVNRPSADGLIWHNDGVPILPHEDGQAWRDLLVRAGVISAADAVPGGTALTGHVARHTLVTLLAAMGVDFQIIAEIVGHSSVQVTQMYRHAQASEKRDAMKKLGTALESAGLPQIEA